MQFRRFPPPSPSRYFSVVCIPSRSTWCITTSASFPTSPTRFFFGATVSFAALVSQLSLPLRRRWCRTGWWVLLQLKSLIGHVIQVCSQVKRYYYLSETWTERHILTVRLLVDALTQLEIYEVNQLINFLLLELFFYQVALALIHSDILKQQPESILGLTMLGSVHLIVSTTIVIYSFYEIIWVNSDYLQII